MQELAASNVLGDLDAVQTSLFLTGADADGVRAGAEERYDRLTIALVADLVPDPGVERRVPADFCSAVNGYPERVSAGARQTPSVPPDHVEVGDGDGEIESSIAGIAAAKGRVDVVAGRWGVAHVASDDDHGRGDDGVFGFHVNDGAAGRGRQGRGGRCCGRMRRRGHICGCGRLRGCARAGGCGCMRRCVRDCGRLNGHVAIVEVVQHGLAGEDHVCIDCVKGERRACRGGKRLESDGAQDESAAGRWVHQVAACAVAATPVGPLLSMDFTNSTGKVVPA